MAFKAGEYSFDSIEKEDARRISQITGFTVTYVYYVLDTRNPRKNDRISQAAEKYFSIKLKHSSKMEEEISKLISEFNQAAEPA